MKVLHTADWHLGKKLDGFSRMEEQVEVMDEICQIANEQDVDLVIVAGDLFDAFNPPIDAIELLYKTLKRLSKSGERPVLAIAGNHDSPSLIDAPDPLARESGIILVGYPNAEVRPFALENFEVTSPLPGMLEIIFKAFDYPVRIIHTPYANELRLREFLGVENREQALSNILKESWQNAAETYCDSNGVNLLTAHLYMMKRGGEILEEPEGEKPLKIGNADLIYSEIIPKQIQYTALGHLHAYRNIDSAEKPVVYASSPLSYSFSEAGQQKYVVMADLEPGKKAELERIPLTSGKPLVRKTFDDVDIAIDWLKENPNSLVELTIKSNHFLKASDRKRLIQSHAGIIHLIPEIKNNQTDEGGLSKINLSEEMEVLFTDYFRFKNNQQKPNEELINLFKEILAQTE